MKLSIKVFFSLALFEILVDSNLSIGQTLFFLILVKLGIDNFYLSYYNSSFSSNPAFSFG